MADEPNLERTRQSDRIAKIGLRLGEEDVSRLWLFHFDMRLRTASVPMGGIGGVGTNDEYRKRGFAARIMDDSVAYMADHDLDVGMLFGIQDFYERWGYITAMAGHEIRIEVADLPASDAVVEAVGYESDVHRDAVLAMYAAGNTTRSCAAMRGSHYWTEFEKGTDWDEAPDGKMLLGEDGASIAYLNMVGDPERTRVAEAFFATPPAMAAAAAYLARRAADAGHETVTLSSPPDDPFARYLRRTGSMHFEHTRSSGGGMLRIIRLTPLLEKLADYMTERLAAGGLHGWTGAIALQTDIGDVTLTARDGAVSVQDGGASTADLVAELPQDRLMQLLVGYRDAATIALDDGVEMSAETVRVLDAFFPSAHPYMWWSDRF